MIKTLEVLQLGVVEKVYIFFKADEVRKKNKRMKMAL